MVLIVGSPHSKAGILRTFAIRLFAVAVAGAMLLAVASEDLARAQSKQVQEQNTLLGPQELQALVAPIALYPDPLLAEVLMASSYPLEIVQADRWLKENEQLKGDALTTAADKAGWDQSVASLVATPSVLEMMSSKLDWTQKLGDAVLAQQPDVMAAVQALRAKASANDKLTTTNEQKVVVSNDNGKQLISIEPAVPETISVPYYDPGVVYGAWPYSDYPAYYFPPPPYIPGAILASGLAFGAGYALGRWTSGGNYWGGGMNWNHNNININRPRVNPLGGGSWAHNPAHRGGVKYGNSAVQQRFGGSNPRSNASRKGQKAQNSTRGQAGAGRNQTNAKSGMGPANKSANASHGARQGNKSAKQSGRHNASEGPETIIQKVRRPPPRQTPKASSVNRSAAASHNPRTNAGSGMHARAQSMPGRNSFASARGGGGAARAHAGRGGGGRGGGGRGGGRRSDIRLKHDIVLLGYMRNGIGIYRFEYNNDRTAYVGVLAQQVQNIAPSAVMRGRDGYLRVRYSDVGVRFQTYRHWMSTQADDQGGMNCRLDGCRAAP